MAGATLLAFWLVPAEPERAFLSAVVRILAAQLHSVAFEPHVTVFATARGLIEPQAILRQIDAHRIELRIREIDYSDKFTKSLFVQFDPDDSAQRLSDEIRRACGDESDYELNPHLSLVYQNICDRSKEDLASGIALPFEHLTFDLVKAVVCPSAIDTGAAVEAFKVVASHELTA